MQEKLRKLLLRHEGMRLSPYQDSLGNLTIGVGWALEKNPMRESEALFRLNNDLEYFLEQLEFKYDWFVKLNDVRKSVIVNMSFNLGLKGFASFRKMIKLIEDEKYQLAAVEMLDSRWALQVGKRADELSEMLATGRWLNELAN